MSPQRPRTPGVILAAIAVVLLALVGLFALTQRQPPPPSIAEFAPQAVDKITDAPADQSSSSSSGGSGRGDGGGEGSGEPTPTGTGTGSETIDVARVRRCVGDPPRQIEDPQSPPCVPFFAGDNGGATTRGVTRDEIRVGIPDWDEGYSKAIAAFFNARFEFYGRRLNVMQLPVAGTTDIGQRATAQTAESMQLFAAGQQYNADAYNEELARRRIVSLSRNGTFTEHEHRRMAPYLWSYITTADKVADALGEWTCARLAKRPAAHAGTGSQGEPRAFGLILREPNAGSSKAVQPLRDPLASCGSALKDEAVFAYNASPEAFDTAVLKMRDAEVTSVFVLGVDATQWVMKSATRQSYFPEWIVSSYVQDDTSFWNRGGYPPEQASHAFGLTFQPREQRADENPSRWAFNEGAPGVVRSPDAATVGEDNIDYRTMLVLASGIQLAGPRLTPESFERGLQAARFPNPPHRIMAGGAGFAGDHSMTEDAAEMWWSTRDVGVYAGDSAGRWCYPSGGARHRPGTWPDAPPQFFTVDCGP